MLLAVPALRTLRAGRPAARLVLGAQERIGALLVLLGAVDDHVSFDALGLDALFCSGDVSSGVFCSGGREAGSDRGWPEIDAARLRTAGARLRPLVEAEHVVSWFGARDPTFVARVRALAPGAVVAPSVGPDGPVWEHLLATVGGDPIVADRAPLSVPASLIADGDRALRAAGWDGEMPLLMIHPGAGGIAKRWPAEGFARVLAELGSSRRLALAVHQGPADADAVADLSPRYRGPIVRLTDPTLPVLAGAMTHATAWLGNDSGVSHLAAALGVPSLVLFTASNLAWRPWCDAARPLVVETSVLRAPDLLQVIAAITALLG